MPVKIQHYRDMGEFEYGVAVQVTPLIRRVICKNPMPFTYKGTGTYIVDTICRELVASVDITL